MPDAPRIERNEMNRGDLLENLKDPEYREGFAESHVYLGLSFQIRALRKKRQMTQADLGGAANMSQERISILEDPNAESKPLLSTLLRLANAFGVGLQVRFAPFSELIDEAIRTEEEDVIGFEDELPALESRAILAAADAVEGEEELPLQIAANFRDATEGTVKIAQDCDGGIDD